MVVDFSAKWCLAEHAHTCKYIIPCSNFILEHTHDKVSLILQGVVAALANDTKGRRRFVWDEMAFLQLWWDEQASAKQKAQFTQFVKNGQIEFVDNGCV